MKKNSPAFTLIELLVVFSILAILGAVSFAGYTNYSRAQLLKNAAKELRTNLQLAQNKAITQEKPQEPNLCPQLTGYKLQFDVPPNEKRYKIYRICSGVGEVNVRTFNLPSEITRSGASSVTFKAGTGSVDSPATFTLTSSFGGSETITVTSTGVIQ